MEYRSLLLISGGRQGTKETQMKRNTDDDSIVGSLSISRKLEVFCELVRLVILLISGGPAGLEGGCVNKSELKYRPILSLGRRYRRSSRRDSLAIRSRRRLRVERSSKSDERG